MKTLSDTRVNQGKEECKTIMKRKKEKHKKRYKRIKKFGPA